MNVKTINEVLSVSDQIVADDVAAFKSTGFRLIICNWRDGERAEQPSFSEVQTVAKSNGVVMRYQPIVPGKATNAGAAKFRKLMDELPKSVLTFRRTGSRSTTLWLLKDASR